MYSCLLNLHKITAKTKYQESRTIIAKDHQAQSAISTRDAKLRVELPQRDARQQKNTALSLNNLNICHFLMLQKSCMGVNHS